MIHMHKEILCSQARGLSHIGHRVFPIHINLGCNLNVHMIYPMTYYMSRQILVVDD